MSFSGPLKMASSQQKKAAAALIIALILKKKPKRRRKSSSCNVRPWLKRRGELGAYHSLVKELQEEYREGYCNFLRMDEDLFQELQVLLRKD